MKKIFIFTLAAVMFSMTACKDFLTIQPVSVVSEADLLNPVGLEQILTAAYSTMYSGSQTSNLMNYTPEAFSGDANKGSNANDQPDWGVVELFKFPITNGYVTGKYTAGYNGVFRANKVLDIASKIKDQLDPTYYTQVEAQARFLRGLWYLDLVKWYSAAIPWVGLEEFQSATNPLVSNVDESGKYIYIWDNIVADFKFAYDNLPDTWPAGDKGRPNKWAAFAYMIKTQIYMASPYNAALGDNSTGANQTALWPTIKTNLETLMNDGHNNYNTEYALVESYGSLFNFSATGDHTTEAIFEIEGAISGTSSDGSTMIGASNYFGVQRLNGWGFLNPTTDLAQSYVVTEAGIPDVASSALPWEQQMSAGYRNLATYPVMSSKNATTGDIDVNLNMFTDPRLDVVVGRFQVPFLDWKVVPQSTNGFIRDETYDGYYYPKKVQKSSADASVSSLSVAGNPTSTVKNPVLIRLAQVYLWYAEACIRTGDLATARTYINYVRERAANYYVKSETEGTTYQMIDMTSGSPVVVGTDAAANYRIGLWPEFANEQEALDALYAESRAELALEGQRWFDVVRWGISVNYLTAYARYENTFSHGARYADAMYPAEAVYMPLPFAQINTMQGLLVQTANWK